MSHHQNVGRNSNLPIGNKSLENMATFKYSGTTVTEQNFVHMEIRSILNFGNACYRSVQSVFSCRVFSKNVNLKVYLLFYMGVKFGPSLKGKDIDYV
jgi:hypothetical protein